MHIVADENIPGLEKSFELLGHVERCPGREITNSQIQNADVLLVRSVTRVHRQLLAGSKVKFLGSATIGIDHIDVQAVRDAGIHFCHAPGCNADGAAQYTLAMIMLAASRAGLQLARLRAGIVGLGNVGSRLKRLLLAAGVGEVVSCDPPLAAAGHSGLVSMEEISQCNLVSFHVPLSEKGPYSTRNLADTTFFSRLPAGTLLINSARGGVVEPMALTDWLNSGNGFAALDVWPQEPLIATSLLEKVTVGTPHVAGYSLDGKLNGTRMLFEQFLEWLGNHSTEPVQPEFPAPATLEIPPENSLETIIRSACPVERDDRALRNCARGLHHVSPAQFDHLRSNYPVRRDFASIELSGRFPAHLAETLEILGFRLRAG